MTDKTDKSGPAHLVSPKLAAAGVTHAFFGRRGGVSEGLYESLNAGPGSSDAPAAVAENRRRCAVALGAEPDRLYTLYQVHSADVVVLDEARTAAFAAGELPRADAQATTLRGAAIGVLAADCMPWLMADAHAGVVAAVHAGWRGALAGVLEATVSAMSALGAHPGRIIAALGPCLRQPNFEVGLDLVEGFVSRHPYAERYFSPGVSGDKRQFDLAAFGASRLQAVGVEDIDDVGACTLGESAAYFSYRGSRAAGATDYGRNLSLIRL